MSVPRRNFGTAEEGKTRPVVEEFVANGFWRLDLLHHGVSKADHGGHAPFSTAKAFEAHLDELAALEREGRIVVTDYAGIMSEDRLDGTSWPHHGALPVSAGRK